MGLDDGVGLFRPLVEGVALDADHRPGLALGGVDLGLHLLLHLGDRGRVADDLHARGGVVDEAVERVDREHRLRHPRQRGVDAEEEAEGGLARHGLGREVGVAQDEVVAVAHGAQRLQHVGVQERVDPLEHSIPLGVASS